MIFHIRRLRKLLATNLTLVSWAIGAMNSFPVSTQVVLTFKLSAANFARVSGAVNSMNISHMFSQVLLLFKILAANLALVPGVRMLWSWRWRRYDVALSMRCVVVSTDSCFVAPCLEQNNLIAEHWAKNTSSQLHVHARGPYITGRAQSVISTVHLSTQCAPQWHKYVKTNEGN